MPVDFAMQLREDLKEELARSSTTKFAVIGHTPDAYEITSLFLLFGAGDRLLGIYSDQEETEGGLVKPMQQLSADKPDVLVVADDRNKERLILAAEKFADTSARVLLAGYGHLEFSDETFEQVTRNALVPSLANGYPCSLIHIYQCLRNAARLKLSGVVAEFGVFKGGTTMMLSRFIEELGCDWKVLGFDTFAGFPPKRSLLDMYAHDDCMFSGEESVRSYLADRNIELIKGDLVETAKRLSDTNIVVAFFDTDNFTSTSAVLDVVQDRVIPGGALIFDHFTGAGRFRYTLGERLAAKRLLVDERYFHLHGTGVFLRQR